MAVGGHTVARITLLPPRHHPATTGSRAPTGSTAPTATPTT
jgi:hypothetical protein